MLDNPWEERKTQKSQRAVRVKGRLLAVYIEHFSHENILRNFLFGSILLIIASVVTWHSLARQAVSHPICKLSRQTKFNIGQHRFSVFRLICLPFSHSSVKESTSTEPSHGSVKESTSTEPSHGSVKESTSTEPSHSSVKESTSTEPSHGSVKESTLTEPSKSASVSRDGIIALGVVFGTFAVAMGAFVGYLIYREKKGKPSCGPQVRI